jgi:hypothetical protein
MDLRLVNCAAVANVVLCFSREDQESADRIFDELARFVTDVSLDDPLEREADDPNSPVNAGSCVVVLWSHHSRADPLIRRAALRAKNRKALVSVTLDTVQPHGGFLETMVADLKDWLADGNDIQFQRLVQEVRRLASADSQHDRALLTVERGTHVVQASNQTNNVFICYRHDDHPGAASELYVRLTGALGSDRVFIDDENIPLGANYTKAIDAHLSRSAVMLVLIGPQWTHTAERRHRLSDPHDPVRLEIAKAFERGVIVIPIFVAGARPPQPDDLPEDIRELAFAHGLTMSGRPSETKTLVKRVLDNLERVNGKSE